MTQKQDNPFGADSIRPLSNNDLEAVIALDTGLTGTSRRGFFEKRLSGAIERPKEYVYVRLFDADKLVGFAMAKLVEGEFGQPGARATLDALGVEQGHQNSGAGHQLMDAVKGILIHKGVSALDSEVDWDNRVMLSFFGDAGFCLAPRIILTRTTDELPVDYDDNADDAAPLEIDYSSPDSDEFQALSRDKVPVRSMAQSDLDAIIRIDAKLSGGARESYYKRKAHENLEESGVRVSLVAELDGYPVGFIMARVDFGAFGRTIKTAVMDTIGVNPGYQGQGVGQALMSQLVANLSVLRVETLRTEVDWNDVKLIGYFSETGFVPAQRMKLTAKL